MEVDGKVRPFLLFSKPKSNRQTEPQPQVQAQPTPQKAVPTPADQTDHGDSDSGDSGSDSDSDPAPTVVTEHGDTCSADGAAADALASFTDLGLSEWLVDVCSSLGMRRPTAMQRRCIPRALAGENVLGIAEMGSGKMAAFALPILHRLGEDPFGVAALALAPMQELAAQLPEQFRAPGSPLGLRCLAAIGGFDSLTQAKGLARHPHVAVATPGRIATLIKNDPDLAKVFARTKFLVLDEADRVVDANFEEDLNVIFDCYK